MQLIENASEQKLRGAYYTPSAIAEFILRWGTYNGSTADILEPSCGDSVFLRGMAKIGMPYRSVTAVESQKATYSQEILVTLRGNIMSNSNY